MSNLSNQVRIRRPTAILSLSLALTLVVSGCLGDERQSKATEVATSADQSPATVPIATTAPPASPSPTPESTSAIQESVTQPTSGPNALTPSEIIPSIDNLVANLPARVGIVIEQMDGSVIYERSQDDQFEAASLYKLAVMAEVYREREAGMLRFDDLIPLQPGFFVEGDDVYALDTDAGAEIPVSDALYFMITASSNVAAAALLNAVGTPQVNELMSTLGLDSTEIRWEPSAEPDDSPLDESLYEELIPDSEPTDESDELTEPDTDNNESIETRGIRSRTSKASHRHESDIEIVAERTSHAPATTAQSRYASIEDAYNLTTPNDMARFFRLLLAGEVVTPAASTAMLELLAQQMINDRLPATLPDDARVAHKTGNLPDAVHDAGVIYGQDGPIIVVVMSDEIEDEEAVVEFIQAIGSFAYSVMSPS